MSNDSFQGEYIYEYSFRYRDVQYDTKATLELILYTSTSNNKTFSPLKTKISIYPPDELRRYCTFTYPDLYELVDRLKEVTNGDLNEIYNQSEPLKVDKRTYDCLLRFTFKKSKNGEKCVIVGVMKNRTDYALCILPLRIFFSFLAKLEYVVQNDSYLQSSIGQKILENKKVENLSEINQQLKTLPYNLSELIGSTNTDRSADIHDEIDPESFSEGNPDPNIGEEDPEEVIGNFDEYIGNNLDNFNLEGEKDVNKEEENKNVIPVESYFFEKVLNKDISNLESLVNRTLLSNSKLESFSSTIEEECGINPLTDYFKNNDIKSACYISEFLLQVINKDYILFGSNYPSSVTILKAKPEKTDDEIYTTACDLMLTHCYLKNFRTLIENRTSDPHQCKSDLHVNFRLLSDFISLGILERFDSDKVKKNILSRFRYFNSQGYFDSFNQILKNFNYKEITEKDINEYLSLVLSKLPGMMDVYSFHKKFYNEEYLKLPYENELTLKNVKEAAKLDVVKYMGFGFEEESLKKFGFTLDEISEDVYNLYIKGKTKSKSRTNILKYVDSFASEIPEDCKQEFRNYIYNLGKDNFDFDNSGFDLSRFGENVVKALYLWNKSNKIERFTDFYSKCRDSLLTKEEVLNIGNKEEEIEQTNWGDILD